MYLSVEMRFSSKSWKFEYNQSSKMFTMDRKYVKHWFKIIQKHSKVTFESTDIISDHSDTFKAKVDRDEPVQVIRMIIWWIIYYFTVEYGLIWSFWWPERVHPGPLLLLKCQNDQIWYLCSQKWLLKASEWF